MVLRLTISKCGSERRGRRDYAEDAKNTPESTGWCSVQGGRLVNRVGEKSPHPTNFVYATAATTPRLRRTPPRKGNWERRVFICQALRGNAGKAAAKAQSLQPNPNPFLVFFCVLCVTSAPSAFLPPYPHPPQHPQQSPVLLPDNVCPGWWLVLEAGFGGQRGEVAKFDE